MNKPLLEKMVTVIAKTATEHDFDFNTSVQATQKTRTVGLTACLMAAAKIAGELEPSPATEEEFLECARDAWRIQMETTIATTVIQVLKSCG